MNGLKFEGPFIIISPDNESPGGGPRDIYVDGIGTENEAIEEACVLVESGGRDWAQVMGVQDNAIVFGPLITYDNLGDF